MKKTEEQRPDITMMMDITRLSLREGKNQHPQRTGMIIQRNLKTEVPNTAAKAEKGKDVEEERMWSVRRSVSSWQSFNLFYRTNFSYCC